MNMATSRRRTRVALSMTAKSERNLLILAGVVKVALPALRFSLVPFEGCPTHIRCCLFSSCMFRLVLI